MLISSLTKWSYQRHLDYTEAAKAINFDGALCEVASLEKDRRTRHANQRPGGHVSCYATAAQYVTDSAQQLPFTITISPENWICDVSRFGLAVRRY